MQTPLLFTKLYIPPFLPSRVSRPRLTERLTESIYTGIKLLLLAAPAGSGKSALLSEWLAQIPVKAAWLSLDEGDTDPIRFWDYFVAALQQIDTRIGQDALALFHEPTPLPIQSILVSLINDMGATQEPFVLVLDDYHVVNSPAIHEGLAFLLDPLPPMMRLVVTTRTDPPLPLARLRARSELLELRASDLQFSASESAQFVSRLIGVELTDELVNALKTRTEGWAAGLQLAALALRGHNNPDEFIDNFAGTNRFIVDYLGDEVLDKQPVALQQFLMRTSILGQLNGELCATLTDQPDAQGVLETLERNNYFVHPVDDKRRWYRYHQLFRDFLQHRLEQREGEQVQDLHKRASVWFEQHGYIEEAIRHALAIGDHTRAGELIESIADYMIWRRAEHYRLLEWLGALPEALIRSRPKLALYHAWTFYLTTRREAAIERAQAAEQALEHDGSSQDANVRGMLYAVQSTLTGIQQDFETALRTGRMALEHLPGSEIIWRCMAAINLGVSSAAVGEMGEAVRTLNYAMELSQEIGSAFALLSAFWHLATLQTTQLHLRDAERTCYQGQAVAVTPGIRRFPVSGFINVLLAEILLERNQLAEAEPYFLEGTQQINPEGNPMALLRCYLGLVRLKRLQNDLSGSDEWFRRAEQFEHVSRIHNRASGFGAYRGWRLIQEGDLATAWRWVEENRLGLDNDLSYHREPYYLVLARLLIASAQSNPDHLSGALRLLNRMIERASSSGRTGSLVRALSLQALALDDAGESEAAIESMKQALVLVEPEQCITTFADEGPSMVPLLQKVLQSQQRAAHDNRPRPSPEYLATILTAMGTQGSPILVPAKYRSAMLVEQLSERELEVLRLLSQGLSSNEIAARLVISVETARKHIKNIYGKLDVHSQFEAARRAQEIGLF